MINRCICHNVSFAKMLQLMADKNLTIKEAMEKTGAGGNCGLCIPYIRLSVEIGKTSHPVIDRGKSNSMVRKMRTSRTRQKQDKIS